VDSSVHDTLDLLEHDTVDVKDEVESEEDFSDVALEGSLEVARHARREGIVELVLISIVNGVWAVVGLVLWLPQVVRATLGAILKTVHSALTHQSSHRAIAGIRHVSRSYADRFLSRRGDTVLVGRRHEFRPFQLLVEVVWALGFYLVLMRWLTPSLFAPIWDRVLFARDVTWILLVDLWGSTKAMLQPDLASLDVTKLQAGGVLFVAAIVGLGLGIWLGRRGR